MQGTSLVMLFLVLILNFDSSSSLRVRERFLGWKNPDIPCKVLVSDRFSEIELMSRQTPNFRNAFNDLFDFLTQYNCSFISSHISDFLSYLPNGTYTTGMGFIQRNQVDTMFFTSRPDSLPFDPAIIGPVVESADVSMLTKRLE